MENKIQRKRGRPAKPPLKIDVEGTIFESPISMEELEQAMEPTPINVLL